MSRCLWILSIEATKTGVNIRMAVNAVFFIYKPDVCVNLLSNLSKSCVDSKAFKTIPKSYPEYRILSQQLAHAVA